MQRTMTVFHSRTVVLGSAAILSLLAILIVVIRGIYFSTDNGPVEKTKMRLRTLATILSTYEKKTGQLPTIDQGLNAAIDSANVKAVARPLLLRDAWNAPFIYKPGASPTLYSMGENGIDDLGEGDDITVSIRAD